MCLCNFQSTNINEDWRNRVLTASYQESLNIYKCQKYKQKIAYLMSTCSSSIYNMNIIYAMLLWLLPFTVSPNIMNIEAIWVQVFQNKFLWSIKLLFKNML